MVTSPAVPPNSSTTAAMCTLDDCISRSRSRTGLVSGTKWAGRATSVTGTASEGAFNRCSRSLAYTTPTMSSAPSPVTGTREKPCSRIRSRAWSVVMPALRVTMSVRGTITSRTMAPENSSTEEMSRISSRSAGS